MQRGIDIPAESGPREGKRAESWLARPADRGEDAVNPRRTRKAWPCGTRAGPESRAKPAWACRPNTECTSIPRRAGSRSRADHRKDKTPLNPDRARSTAYPCAKEGSLRRREAGGAGFGRPQTHGQAFDRWGTNWDFGLVSEESRISCNVEPLLARLADATHDGALNRRRVGSRPVNEGSWRLGCRVRRTPSVEDVELVRDNRPTSRFVRRPMVTK